ncbi:MAG: hypothetical protein XXXJIFNMEKO3_00621 [Candidatus Erwinia impunctatus]|nr:hypothetical protein XXXJIFNMEKO_00621 [Culicoides impunctatus]
MAALTSVKMLFPLMSFVCGGDSVNIDRDSALINGVRVIITDIKFTGAPNVISSSVMTLYPAAITTKNRQYRLTISQGVATLETLTTETPPRKLISGQCKTIKG